MGSKKRKNRFKTLIHNKLDYRIGLIVNIVRYTCCKT